jgi:hypothetical protein
MMFPKANWRALAFCLLMCLAPTQIAGQNGDPAVAKLTSQVVFMSTPVFKSPNTIIYSYGKDRPFFPRRIKLEIEDVVVGEVVKRIPKRLRIFGCEGPVVSLSAASFSGFEGYFKDMRVIATANSRRICNTRDLDVVLTQGLRLENGEQLEIYHLVKIASDGTIGFVSESLNITRDKR